MAVIMDIGEVKVQNGARNCSIKNAVDSYYFEKYSSFRVQNSKLIHILSSWSDMFRQEKSCQPKWSNICKGKDFPQLRTLN